MSLDNDAIAWLTQPYHRRANTDIRRIPKTQLCDHAALVGTPYTTLRYTTLRYRGTEIPRSARHQREARSDRERPEPPHTPQPHVLRLGMSRAHKVWRLPAGDPAQCVVGRGDVIG